jgi:hypothetical protein
MKLSQKLKGEEGEVKSGRSLCTKQSLNTSLYIPEKKASCFMSRSVHFYCSAYSNLLIPIREVTSVCREIHNKNIAKNY